MSRFVIDPTSGLMMPRKRSVEPMLDNRVCSLIAGTGPAFFAQASSVPTDPNFNDVSLLLPVHDANGSATITDYSPRPKTMTRSGSGTASNTVTKFGNNSYKQGVTGDYLGTPDNSEFDFVSGDWSIEFFVQFNAVGATSQLLIVKAIGTGLYPYSIFLTGTTNKIGLQCFNNASSLVVDIVGTTTISAGVQYFIQAVRSGNVFSINVDGAQEASVNPGATTMYVTAGKFTIGNNDAGGGLQLDGYVNSLRVTKGVARQIAVPTAQWPEA